MIAVNDVTGDKLQSKIGDTDAYSKGYDLIFASKPKEEIKQSDDNVINRKETL
jgi:hypothetical protein